MKKWVHGSPDPGLRAGSWLPVKEQCREHGFSEASDYLWRSKFGGMSVSDAKRLQELQQNEVRENVRPQVEVH